MLTIEPVRKNDDVAEVRRLFQEYADSIDTDLCFQGFAAELAGLPGDYTPPRGELLLAQWDGRPVGCVALRPLDEQVCEMKRLFVEPEFRAHGVGRVLVERVIETGKALGYRSMRLDSLPSMERAIALYRQLGFRDTAPYRHNPVAGTVYLELSLNGSASEA
jgi:putative acetyltransferase